MGPLLVVPKSPTRPGGRSLHPHQDHRHLPAGSEAERSIRINEGEPLAGGSFSDLLPGLLVDCLTWSDGDDLDHGPGDPVHDPEPGDPTTSQTSKLVAKDLADGWLVEQILECGPDLALQVRMETPDQRGDVIGDS